ncbi:MAG: hypothetical protein HY851_03660 [candidate division Zixibacteria bacterium]|nr:hypothetical protein [candidate division Zixibacteria bacterium]
MKKPLTIVLLFAAAVCLVLGCSQSAPTYLLKFNYVPGSTLDYEQIVKGTVVSREKDSMTADRLNTVTTTIEFDVRRVVDDTTFEIVQKTSSKRHTENRLDSTTVDTTETSPDMTMYIAPSGRVLDMEMGDGKEAEYATYWKEYFRQGTPVFPAQPVAVGHVWTQTFSVTVDGKPVNVSSTYTITGVEKRQGYECVAVGYTGKMVLPFDAAPSDSTRRRGVDRISNEGVMYFAYKDGFTVAQNEKWVLDGDRLKRRDGQDIAYTVHVVYDVTMDLKEIKKK